MVIFSLLTRLQLGAPTVANKRAFVVGSQNNPPVVSQDIAIYVADCNKIVWQWVYPSFGTGAYPVRGRIQQANRSRRVNANTAPFQASICSTRTPIFSSQRHTLSSTALLVHSIPAGRSTTPTEPRFRTSQHRFGSRLARLEWLSCDLAVQERLMVYDQWHLYTRCIYYNISVFKDNIFHESPLPDVTAVV